MKILRFVVTLFTLTTFSQTASADLVSQAQYVSLVQALTEKTALPLHRQFAIELAREPVHCGWAQPVARIRRRRRRPLRVAQEQ